MNITVNGENRGVAEETTVTNLLESLGLNAEATVVQRNGEVVDRTLFADTRLEEDDILELVRFVAGG